MTSPRSLLKAWGVYADKRWGQNFLADPHMAGLIVKRAGLKPDDIVLEIGAGTGALTIPISRSVQRVVAVERDKRMAELLRNELLAASVDNVIITQENILSFDFEELGRTCSRPIVVMGNLPYNISSQILIRLIRYREAVSTAVLMFQKELADRIMAAPGNKIYGRLSVVVQYCARVAPLITVGASSFYPRPKVDSEVLRIEFETPVSYPASDESLFFNVVRAAFSQRRKTIKNALKGGNLGIDAEGVLDVLDRAGIDSQRRPETLGVKEFVDISNLIQET
ncbi:MAG: ribosomal RNA small subunit methyltransferase A [Deltaproteobacteria bacterium]|nr:ribosomal RNA small subunit methyltransferase A [Deltaproteobacteria bacterium]